jgi:hypothetical protein
VVVVPTATVAAAPVAPVEPVAPVSPRGIVKFNVCVGAVPVIVDVAELPAAPVVTVPIDKVLAGPVAPVAPVGIPKASAYVALLYEAVAEEPADRVVAETLKFVAILIDASLAAAAEVAEFAALVADVEAEDAEVAALVA